MGCGASTSKPAASQQAASAPDPTRSQGPEVPPRKLYALKEAFRAIDENGSGSISAAELGGLLSKVGKDDLTEEERASVLKAIDKNDDRQIEFREFVEWVLSNEGNDDAISHWSLNKGLSELHQAAIAGDEKKIQELIDGGAKVTSGDFNDVTPLHYSARVGKLEGAKVLLKNKADVSARTSDTKRMPLHAAAENGSVDMVRLLLEAKSEVNAQDLRQRTPLHWACCTSREGAAAELLRAKADVNVKSVAGYTPFAMAQDWSTTTLANMIQDAGGQR